MKDITKELSQYKYQKRDSSECETPPAEIEDQKLIVSAKLEDNRITLSVDCDDPMLATEIMSSVLCSVAETKRGFDKLKENKDRK